MTWRELNDEVYRMDTSPNSKPGDASDEPLFREFWRLLVALRRRQGQLAPLHISFR
jgi:hypothetical protein